MVNKIWTAQIAVQSVWETKEPSFLISTFCYESWRKFCIELWTPFNVPVTAAFNSFLYLQHFERSNLCSSYRIYHSLQKSPVRHNSSCKKIFTAKKNYWYKEEKKFFLKSQIRFKMHVANLGSISNTLHIVFKPTRNNF